MSSRFRRSSKSMKKSKITTTNEPPNPDEIIDYGAAYKLQDSNILLQESMCSSMKQLSGILSKCVTRTEEWKETWYQLYANEHSKINVCESIWALFGAAISSIDGYVEKTNSIIENLKVVRDSIPKIDPQQEFKLKIKQARANVDKFDKELKKLEEDRINLETKVNELNSGSSNIFYKLIKPKKQREVRLLERQSSINASIEDKKRSLEKSKKTFCKKQNILYQEFKKDEIQRWKSLQEQTTDFLKSLDITSDHFNQTSTDYNPENVFQKWEQQVFYPDANQSCKSKKTEDRNLLDENKSEN